MNRKKAPLKKIEPVNDYGKMQEAPVEEMQEAPVEEIHRNPVQKQWNEHKISKYMDSSHVVKTRLANREQLRLSNFPTALAASLPVLKILEAEPEVLEAEDQILESKDEDSESKAEDLEAKKKYPIVFKVPKLQCPNCSFESESPEEVADHIIETYTSEEDLYIWRRTSLIPKETQQLIDRAFEQQKKGAYIKIDIKDCTKVLLVPVSCPVYLYLAKTGVEVSKTRGRNFHNFQADIMAASESFRIYFNFDPVAQHQKKVHDNEGLKHAFVLKEDLDNMEELLNDKFNIGRKVAIAAYLNVAPETGPIVKAVKAAPICDDGDDLHNCRLKQKQMKEKSRKQMKNANEKAEKDKAERIKREQLEGSRSK